MKCPFCESKDLKVLDSRATDNEHSTRRRRYCNSCGGRFTTYEKIDLIPLVVVKNDQEREQFDKNKLSDMIRNTCYKLSIPQSDLNDTINKIETEIARWDESEITTKDIREIVEKHLLELDKIAYIRFISAYCDLNELKDIIINI